MYELSAAEKTVLAIEKFRERNPTFLNYTRTADLNILRAVFLRLITGFAAMPLENVGHPPIHWDEETEYLDMLSCTGLDPVLLRAYAKAVGSGEKNAVELVWDSIGGIFVIPTLTQASLLLPKDYTVMMRLEDRLRLSPIAETFVSSQAAEDLIEDAKKHASVQAMLIHQMSLLRLLSLLEGVLGNDPQRADLSSRITEKREALEKSMEEAYNLSGLVQRKSNELVAEAEALINKIKAATNGSPSGPH